MRFSLRTWRRPLVIGGVVTILLVALASAAYVLGTRRDTRPSGRVAPTPASPSVSPAAIAEEPAERSDRVRPQVRVPFNDRHGMARGRRLALAVYWQEDDDDCVLHSYEFEGRTAGAYRTDCASWDKDLIIFLVGLKNTTSRPVTVKLGNFVLVARDGRTFPPIGVRSEAEFPANFLSERHRLPPGKGVYGYLTFDGNVERLTPGAISYIDGRQTLTQVFKGRPS